MGWGTIPDDHPQMVGMAGLQTTHRYGNATVLASDHILGIGNRWANRHTGTIEVYTKGRTFTHVDIEPTQIGRVFMRTTALPRMRELRLNFSLRLRPNGKRRQAEGPLGWAGECASARRPCFGARILKTRRSSRSGFMRK